MAVVAIIITHFGCFVYYFRIYGIIYRIYLYPPTTLLRYLRLTAKTEQV